MNNAPTAASSERFARPNKALMLCLMASLFCMLMAFVISVALAIPDAIAESAPVSGSQLTASAPFSIVWDVCIIAVLTWIEWSAFAAYSTQLSSKGITRRAMRGQITIAWSEVTSVTFDEVFYRGAKLPRITIESHSAKISIGSIWYINSKPLCVEILHRAPQNATIMAGSQELVPLVTQWQTLAHSPLPSVSSNKPKWRHMLELIKSRYRDQQDNW